MSMQLLVKMADSKELQQPYIGLTNSAFMRTHIHTHLAANILKKKLYLEIKKALLLSNSECI